MSDETDYLTKFINNYNVYANLDKLFIKKIYDIKEFLENTFPSLNPLTVVIPEVKYDHLMIEKGFYYILLVHEEYEIKIPAPIDGIFIVDGVEKVVISQEIFCTPYFIYKDDIVEYKECNDKGKFQSLEMFADYKYIEYLKKVLAIEVNSKIGDTLTNSRKNVYTNLDMYYTFSNKNRKSKLTNIHRRVILDIRIYYSLFFQYLRIKGIKAHDKQSISLLYILSYLKPEFSIEKIKKIIIETVIGENIPKNIDIIIPELMPEDTLEIIISRRNESYEIILEKINKMIDSYFVSDFLHCHQSSYKNDNTVKFYTYLAMAKALYMNENKNYFNHRIDTFPCSLYRSVKYYTLENVKSKNFSLKQFISNLNYKLFSNIKTGTIRSYFREYSAIGVQSLSKRSYYDKISHIRRVQIPINTESENNELRMTYEYGYFCPFETPESKDVGLVKYLGLSVLVAPDFFIDLNILDPYIFNNYENENNDISNNNNNNNNNINNNNNNDNDDDDDDDNDNDKDNNVNSNYIKKYPVLLNSRFIGFTTTDLVELTYEKLKLKYPFISCIFDNVSYYLFTDEGRIVRPLRVIKNDSNKILGIRLIEISEFKCNTTNYRYEELDPSFVFGFISALLPFPGNNHVPRLTFQAGMTKQCMSNDSTIFNFNDNSRKLINAQRPFCMSKLELIMSRRLCHFQSINNLLDIINGNSTEDQDKIKNQINSRLFYNIDNNNNNQNISDDYHSFIENNKNISKFEKNIHLNNEEFRKRINDLTDINIEQDDSNLITSNNTYHRFGGQNVIVAVMAFGNNQEDSVMFNENSIEKGLFNNIKYRYQYISYNIKEEILIDINSNYENGLPKPNTQFVRNSSCINEPIFRIYNFVKNVATDVENIFRKPVYVEKCYSYVKDNICYCCVEVRHLYKPQQGDKFASRYAQKGVIGSVISEEKIPRTEDGVIPDIIVNPHAFPSRMTVGHLIEMHVGKCMVMNPKEFGTFFNASIESEDLKGLKKKFIESDIPMIEKMVDPKTGDPIGNAFVGVCYYTALQHQVEEKMFYRTMGNINAISKQPTEGKSNNGGLRVGEMEKDALVAHSANSLLSDMFKNNTDIMDIRYCKKCHSISLKGKCCDTSTILFTVSNSFNIVNSYLEAMNIHTTVYE